MNETFDIEDELETCPDSPTSHTNTDAINPTTATIVQPASSSPKRKRPSISGDINNNNSSNRAKVSLFDSSGIAKNGEDELEFLENELIPDDLMAGGDEAIVDTSSSLNGQQNHSQTSENQMISSTLAFPLNDYEMSEEDANKPPAETGIEINRLSISNEVQTVVDDLIEKLCATATTTTIITASTTREEPSVYNLPYPKPLAHMQSIKALEISQIKNDDDHNSKHMSLTTTKETTTTMMMTTASDNSVNDKNTPQTTLILLSPASTHQQQESTPSTATTTMIIMNEEKPQSKTSSESPESSSTTVSNNNRRPQPLPRRIIRSTPLEDTGALEDTTKLIQLNVCAPTSVPQPSQPVVNRASTSVTLSASSSDEVVLVTETVEQTQTVMKKASPAPTSTAIKTTVAKTAVSPPTSRPRTVQTIAQRTTAPPPPQLKKPSVDVASNSTTSNGLVNKSSTLTTATKKVTSSTSSTSSVQKSLVKKLKSMQPPTGLTDSALNKDEDSNSVFETDNQTTCSSDNEISSSKSSSRTNSIKISAQTSQVPTVKKSSQMSSSSNSNIGLAPQPAKDANTIFASATVKKPTIQQRKLTQSVTKQSKGNNNNKENQDQSPISIPKDLTSLGKIYRSRDGLAAVSSNTSIMSELSNISKSSLPSSMPVATSKNNNNVTTAIANNSSNSIQQQPSRHGSISSSSGVKASGHHQQVFQVPPPPPVLRQSTLSQQTTTQTSSTQKPATNVNTVAGMAHRIQSNSSKFLTQLSQHNSQQQQQQQQQAPSTSIRRGSQQQLQQSSATTNIFKKPGQPPSSSLSSSHVVVKSTSSNVEPASVAALLSISTGANATAGIVASLPSSSTSPSSSSAASNRTTAAMSSSSNSNESKLGREIKRLEALCESRTKELSMLKLKLKETLCSFEAIAVAFDYLANKLNGFEAKGLRSKLEFERKKTREQMERLEAKIVEKEKCLNEAHEKLNDLTRESIATRETLEKKLEEQAREFETRLSLLNAEQELILKDVRQSKETAVSRLSKQMDVQKIESERTVSELREALSRKESENIELEARVRECEDALGKDKDERNQRLIEIQKNLEKEIESLKAAIDIKNIDLVQLRTKNNELMTKVDNYNELSIKLRRSKQEIEQLNAIIKIKQEAERRASEHNRVLVMKIEAKNKENQRLSMQNEQLQFRLQSHPNLSANNDSLLTTSNFDTTLNTPNKLDLAQCSSSMGKPRTKTMIETTTTPNNGSPIPSGTEELPQTTSNSLPVKLRSKSFKTTSSTCQNNSLFAEQFRPVSENFDFDDENPSSHVGAGGVSSRDFLMTRSVIVCDSTSSSSSSHRGVGEDDELMVDGNNMESSSCSSNSHMDQNNQSPVSSESCMKSIDEPTINYGVRSSVAVLDESGSPSNVEAPASPAAPEPIVNSPELMSTSIASIIID